jgi:hypothetical protein
VHLDGVERVEELDAVELEDEFPEYLLAEEGSLPPAVEEDNAEEAVGLLRGDLTHEELEVVDVELAVQQFLLARRVLATRYLAHVLLAADLTAGPVFRTSLFQHQFKLALPSLRHQLLDTHFFT